MRYLVSAMLIIVGLIHVLPLSGVLGGTRLSALYGVAIDDPNLAILMRHRAVLFGLFGLFFIGAAFKPAFQGVALLAAFISVFSFLWLAWSVGGYNPQVGRVVTADLIAAVCVVVGGAAHLYSRSG